MLRYLEAFYRNKWKVSIPAFLLLFVGAGLAFFAPKKYEASATIWTETSTYLDVQGVDYRYRTPAEVQASRLSEMIYTETFTQQIIDRVFPGQTFDEVQRAKLIEGIQQGLQISASGEYSIRINFEAPEADVAVNIVRVAIEEYSRVRSESASLQASQAIEFFRERVNTYETVILPRSNKAITDYLAANPEVQRSQREGNVDDPQFALLQRQADLDRETYQRYQQRLDEVMTQSQAASTSQAAAFRVLDQPRLVNAGRAIISKKMLLLYAAVGVGLSLGYAALFLILATELDRTMRNKGDVRRRLQLPVLEVVPDYTFKAEAKTSKRRERKRSKQMGEPARSGV